jgi:deazaflavin-dependent oxidoreductase (nitroreductase family)
VSETDPEYAYVTTTGRVSGRPHTVELWYRCIGDVVWFIAGGGTSSDWVANLVAEPRVSVRIGDDTFEGIASIDDQDAPEARRALAVRYQGWREGQALSGWATTGLTVAIRRSASS